MEPPDTAFLRRLCPPFHCFVLRTPTCTYTLWREGEIADGAVVMALLDYRERDTEGRLRHIESAEDCNTEKPVPPPLRELLNKLCLTPERKEKEDADMELTMNNRVHRWNADTEALRALHSALHRELYALLPALRNCRAAAPVED